MSLATLLIAVVCNALVGWLVLPRIIELEGRHSHFVLRAWLWFDRTAALYGWVPLVACLLAWDFLVWKSARPKVKGWVTRKLLTFSLAAGAAPLLPAWVPAGQPPKEFLSMIAKYPGVPSLLAWAVVLLVVVLLCTNSESRDYLLGHGKALSVVSIALLLLVVTMTVVSWSFTY
ncbi:MAG TPA: hypothetical protein VMB47_10840 [Candidatus Aquilonibacter sp.]|nr:hypothetical protein [Candidatus Aquilonibacter sp.]